MTDFLETFLAERESPSLPDVLQSNTSRRWKGAGCLGSRGSKESKSLSRNVTRSCFEIAKGDGCKLVKGSIIASVLSLVRTTIGPGHRI